MAEAGSAGPPPPLWVALPWSSTQGASLPSCTQIYTDLLLPDSHSLPFKPPAPAAASQRQQVKSMCDIQNIKCAITSLASPLIFCQKCDTKLDDDLAKLTSEGSVWQHLPFPALALQSPPGNLSKCRSQHPAAHQG